MKSLLCAGSILSVALCLACGCSSEKKESYWVVKGREEDALRKALQDAEKAELDAALATNAFRPANTNLAAYTEKGGRRTDDPVPLMLPESARGPAETLVRVTSLRGEGWPVYVQLRLREAVSAPRIQVQPHSLSVDVKFPGAEDLDELAKIIDFGTVTNINRKDRVIDVKADLTRLPRPQRMIESLPTRNPFSQQQEERPAAMGPAPTYDLDELLNGLTHWYDGTRRAACERLGAMQSLEAADQERVLAALRIRLNDVDLSVQIEARKAVSQLESPAKSKTPSTPEVAVVVRVRGQLEVKQLLDLAGKLVSLTGATGVSSSNGGKPDADGVPQWTLKLSGLTDSEAVAKQLTMFEIEAVEPAAKAINLRLKPESLTLIDDALALAEEKKFAASPDAVSMADLLKDPAPADRLTVPVEIDSVGLKLRLPEGFVRKEGTPFVAYHHPVSKGMVHFVIIPGVQEAFFAKSEIDLEMATKMGITVVCSSPTSVAGRKAQLTKLRGVPEDDMRFRIWSLTFLVPGATVVVTANCPMSSDESLDPLFDAVLLSLTAK